MEGATAPHEEDVPPRPQLRIRTPRPDPEDFDEHYNPYAAIPPFTISVTSSKDKTAALLLYLVFWAITGFSVGAAILWPEDPKLLPLIITLPALLYLHGYLFLTP